MEDAVRYLCLVYVDTKLARATSAEDWREIARQSRVFDDGLRASGHLIIANALTEPDTAVTIRVRDVQRSVTDGPFAETREHLGGFFLIEARDMKEAVEIGGRSPMARMGAIEVREMAG
jgi:hypothetical protein